MAPASELPDVGERVQRLAALWRAVVARPPHAIGCTCMGHMLIPAMGAREMEADILDYMRARYAGDGADDLAALLDARAAEREADTPCIPFRAWLIRLPNASLPAAALDRFISDLSATLESLDTNSRAAGSGSRLFCT